MLLEHKRLMHLKRKMQRSESFLESNAMGFLGEDFLSVEDLDIADVNHLLEVSKKMLPYANGDKCTKVLEGAVLANIFFEPSTRTRISFGTAFNRLGGSVSETVGVKFSSIVKGESLYDTSKVISGYSDVMVVRHHTKGTLSEFAYASEVPVINAGDGDGEHPTQALLDLYTIVNEMGRVDGITISFVGDLKYGRTVHSLCMLLSLYRNITFNFVAPDELQLPQYVTEKILLSDNGHKLNFSSNISDAINGVDAIYSTRIQEERFESREEYMKYRGCYQINQKTLLPNQNVLLMHPLPRDSRGSDSELSNDLNNKPNLAIFRQAKNGTPVRMALFALTLGVENLVDKYSYERSWYRR
jgi:aspartate carbamoyltransferase catalytic subunit